MSEFDLKDYAKRIMRSKGFDLADPDNNSVFLLQWPSWKAMNEKYRLADDPDRAEKLRVSFGLVEVKGGSAKVLETFARHLDAQVKTTGSPAWEEAAKGQSDCPYCDNRGIVSDIPVRSESGRFEGLRKYSFACICLAANRFPGMRKAEDWMLNYSVDRKRHEAAETEARLKPKKPPAKLDPNRLALAVFENGDDRWEDM